jgi:terminase, large subunit
MTLAYAYAALQGLRHGRPRQWRDLNLAGDRLGVPAVAHDPETGETDYGGPDRSVCATTNPSEPATAAPEAVKRMASRLPDAPMAETASRREAARPKRKKNRGFKVAGGSTGWF